MKLKRLIASLAAALLVPTLVPIAVNAAPAPSTVVVRPSNMQGWTFINDQTDGAGNGTIVNGPATPPLGVGSVQLTTSTGSDGQMISKSTNLGMKLSDINNLKYSTFQATTNVSNATALALQFNVDQNVTDTDNSYQGRIIYEPYNNNGGVVPKGTWNQWDAFSGGNAKWWFSKSSKFGGNCPQAAPCTLSSIIALYPSIGIHPTLGAVIFKAGSGWTDAFSGNVDALTINNTTYDFEPNLTYPYHQADCKGANWTLWTGRVFKNRVSCIEYVYNHAFEVEGNMKYDANGLMRRASFLDFDTYFNRGVFTYSDANHDHYTVNLAEVRGSGKTVWFAGPVSGASNSSWNGQWLFGKIVDGHPDKISGSFTDQTTAVNGVINMATPSDGPFNAISSSVRVTKYQ